MHQWDAQGLHSLLENQADRQAVERVHDHAGFPQKLRQVLAGEHRRVWSDLNRAVDLRHTPGRSVRFGHPQFGLAAQELPVKVVLLKDVAVDQDQPPHAHAGQRLGDESPQAAQPHNRRRGT